MTSKLSRSELLSKAKRHGVPRAKLMEGMGVSKQTFTNWESRGVPPSMHRKAADVIGCSVDELLGRAIAQHGSQTMTHGYDIGPDASEVGWEWQKLEEPEKSLLRSLISVTVARQVRGRRDARKSPRDRVAEGSKEQYARRDA